MIRKIAITGPESTGKSMLSVNLANYYKTVFVPEFAREYINNLGRSYVQDDILTIAHGQINNENTFIEQAKKYLFCDTELTVCKIWSIVKYENCNPLILKLLEDTPYDFYLLTDIDLPWEYDPQREHPHFRMQLFNMYKTELELAQKPYAIIQGSGEARVKNAIHAIESFFKKM